MEASQQLESPLHENLPVPLPSDIVVENSDSAVTRHLKSSPKCLYSVCSNVYKHFKIVARARSKCQLDALEAIYISLNPTNGLGHQFQWKFCSCSLPEGARLDI